MWWCSPWNNALYIATNKEINKKQPWETFISRQHHNKNKGEEGTCVPFLIAKFQILATKG
jgi:hypothetical protein